MTKFSQSGFLPPVPSLALKVTYLALEEIKPDPRNARAHPKAQLKQLKQSITTFGFTNPILIDQNRVIIAGHGRLAGEVKDLPFEDALFERVRLEALTGGTRAIGDYLDRKAQRRRLQDSALRGDRLARKLLGEMAEGKREKLEEEEWKPPTIIFSVIGYVDGTLISLGLPYLKIEASNTNMLVRVPNDLLAYMLDQQSELQYTLRELRELQEVVEDLDFLDGYFPPRSTLGVGENDIVPRATP